jgi:hypothetical protein
LCSPVGFDGGAKLERDIEHTEGYCYECYTADYLPGYKYIPLVSTGKVFGYKVVLYNNIANTAVRIDAYIDTTGTGQHWDHMWSYIDKGGDPRIDSVRGPVECPGIRPDLPVTWGGPLAGFRINWAGVDFKHLTISEIQAPRW